MLMAQLPMTVSILFMCISIAYGFRRAGRLERALTDLLDEAGGIFAGHHMTSIQKDALHLKSNERMTFDERKSSLGMLRRTCGLMGDRVLVAVPYCLMLFNIVYPVIVTSAFSSFWLECFDGVDVVVEGASQGNETLAPGLDESLLTASKVCYLSVDFSSIACVQAADADACEETPEYASLRSTAMLVILVYAFLLPVLFLYLLLRERKAIQANRKTRLATATEFLHEPYKPQFYYFELIEIARKQVIIGYASFIQPGSLIQLIFGFTIALVTHAIFMVVAPFKHKSDHIAATVASFCTVLMILSCANLQCANLVDQLTQASCLHPSSMCMSMSMPSSKHFPLFAIPPTHALSCPPPPH